MVVIMIFNKQHRGKRELFLQNKVQLKKKNPGRNIRHFQNLSHGSPE